MILPILRYPHALLKKKSSKVEHFDDKLHQLLDDMFETLKHKNGVGLAAVQVGILQRILLIWIPREDGEQYEEDLIEVINPTFLHQEGEILWKEGCLSVPDFFEEIKRFERLTMGYQDRFGNEKVMQADGLLAVALQHEMDHLDGILFVDRLSILKRKKFEKELKKLKMKE